MEPLVLFFTAFMVGFSGAMMPGPVTAVLARHALEKGFRAAPLIAAGHGIPEAVIVFILAAGVSSIISESRVAAVIGLAGGAVLTRISYSMLRGARHGSFSLKNPAHTKGITGSPLLAGMITTLANPYWFLWWATVGAGYIALSLEHGPKGAFLFFSGHLLADLAWLCFLAVIFISGRRFFTDRIYNITIAVLGLFLLAMALYFFWFGLKIFI